MLNEQTIKLVDKYSAPAICLIFPGLFIMDTIFGKGLFSGNIDNIYSFVLLMVWSFVISILFVSLAIASYTIGKELKESGVDTSNVPIHTFYFYAIPQTVALPIITYLIYKVIGSFDCASDLSLLGLSHRVVLFSISILIVCLTSRIIGFFVRWIAILSTPILLNDRSAGKDG